MSEKTMSFTRPAGMEELAIICAREVKHSGFSRGMNGHS